MSKEEMREEKETPSEAESQNQVTPIQELPIQNAAVEVVTEPLVKLNPVTDLYHLVISGWTGACSEGVPHGFGQLTFRSGAIYEGNVEHGLMHGKGKITLATGWSYVGDFFMNAIQGFGKISFPDGSVYEGDVVAGYRHGIGHFQKGQTSYSGNWQAGKRHGKGITRWSSVSYYDGEWEADKCHGFGVRQWPNLDIYKGSWMKGVPEGHGHMIWHQDGQAYVGQWRNGKQEGNGIGTWKGNTPTTYEGGWFQGERCGKGEVKYANGSVYSGHWRKDKKSGQAYITDSSGKQIIAYFDNDRLLGKPRNVNEFHSVTKAQIQESLGEELVDGAPAIVRNIGHVRRLYHSYAKMLPDNQFRLYHIDRICLDYRLVHHCPISTFYPSEESKDPLTPLLFRQLCFFIANIANSLFPAMPLDDSVQKLFDDFLASEVDTYGELFHEDFRDLIPSLQSLWCQMDNSMTGRDFIQFIQKLELPFSAVECVRVLSLDDPNIKANIERNISFVQFAETLISLVVGHKESEHQQELDKFQAEVAKAGTSNSNEKVEEEPKDQKTNEDAKQGISVTSIKSGSLLQTISELSDHPKNESINSQPNSRAETFQFIEEVVMSSWSKWRKICEIISIQEQRRLDKESRVFDLSNLVVTTATNQTSRSISTHSRKSFEA